MRSHAYRAASSLGTGPSWKIRVDTGTDVLKKREAG